MGKGSIAVLLLSHIWPFATPQTAACQAPLFCTISWSLLKFVSIESVMLLNHLILCRPGSPLVFNLSQHQGLFSMSQLFASGGQSSEASHSASFTFSPFDEYSGLSSFRIDWFDLHTVQGTLRSLLQHHSMKASILWHSALFLVQPSQLNMTIRKTISLTIWTCVGKVMSLSLSFCSP